MESLDKIVEIESDVDGSLENVGEVWKNRGKSAATRKGRVFFCFRMSVSTLRARRELKVQQAIVEKCRQEGADQYRAFFEELLKGFC